MIIASCEFLVYIGKDTKYLIADILVLEDEIIISKQSIQLFLKWFKERRTIARKSGSGLSVKLSPTILQIIESAMQNNDETSATQLQGLLASDNIYVSLSTILHNRHQLGWLGLLSAYTQCM